MGLQHNLCSTIKLTLIQDGDLSSLRKRACCGVSLPAGALSRKGNTASMSHRGFCLRLKSPSCFSFLLRHTSNSQLRSCVGSSHTHILPHPLPFIGSSVFISHRFSSHFITVPSVPECPIRFLLSLQKTSYRRVKWQRQCDLFHCWIL